MHWQPAPTAPRDGTMILGDFGWPFPLPAVFCPASQKWHAAQIQCSPGDGPEYYLECDTEDDTELRQWCPVPPLPPKRKLRGRQKSPSSI